MTTDDPRDRALDTLLGRRPEAAASADCLDAETMAAWADGGLERSRRSHVPRRTRRDARAARR